MRSTIIKPFPASLIISIYETEGHMLKVTEECDCFIFWCFYTVKCWDIQQWFRITVQTGFTEYGRVWKNNICRGDAFSNLYSVVTVCQFMNATASQHQENSHLLFHQLLEKRTDLSTRGELRKTSVCPPDCSLEAQQELMCCLTCISLVIM